MRQKYFITAILLLVVAVNLYAADSVPVNDIPKKSGHIENWLVLGPFPNPAIKDAKPGEVSRAGFHTDYLKVIGGEAKAALDCCVTIKSADGLAGPPKLMKAESNGRIYMDRLYENTDFKVAYAFCHVLSTKDQTVYGHLGSDDGVKVWANGRLVLDVFYEARGSHHNQNVFAAELHKGLNTFLVKVDNKKGGWNFLLELYGREYETEYFLERLTGLVIAPESDKLAPSDKTLRFGLAFNTPTVLFHPPAQVVLETPDAQVLARAVVKVGERGSITIPPSVEGPLILKARIDGFMGRSLSGSAGLYRGDVGAIRKKLTVRIEKLCSGKPRGMEAAPWSRHLAVIKYYMMLLHLSESKDTHTMKVLKKRSAALPNLIPRVLEYVRSMEAGKDLLTDKRGGFRAAYISSADDSAQPFTLYVPPNYDPKRRWPFIVRLHGLGGWCGQPRNPEKPLSFLEARVDGRGAPNWYQNLAENDVLEVIAHVRRYYNVDPARIYISGGSMGGFGTWRMATHHPDLFAAAAPYCGWPADAPIENLMNVPLWALHDREDWVVPVDHSRWGVRLLQEWGYSARITESKGFGHNAYGGARDAGLDVDGWILGHRKSAAPRSIIYTTNNLRRSKAYWASVTEFADPSCPAKLKARVAPNNQLYVQLENIETLAIRLLPELFERKNPLNVYVGDLSCTKDGPLPETVYIHKKDNGWEILSENPLRETAFRRYEAGSLANLYAGEPLLIVRGTSGDKELVEAMEKFARDMASHTQSWRPMDFATIPIKRDTEVTNKDIRSRNLLLVGNAAHNSITQRVTGKLPAVEKKGKIVLDGKLSYNLAGRGYTLYHYNPLAPKRLIYIVASDSKAFYTMHNGAVDLALDAEFADDFTLAEAEKHYTIRRISWNKNWKPAQRFFNSSKLPEVFAMRETEQKATMTAIRLATAADYVVCGKLKNEDRDKKAYDVNHATWADHEVTRLKYPVVTATISGAELLEMADVLKKSKRIQILPEPDEKTVAKDCVYRLALFQWMLWDLTSIRKKNLDSIEFATVDWYKDMKRRLYSGLGR